MLTKLRRVVDGSKSSPVRRSVHIDRQLASAAPELLAACKYVLRKFEEAHLRCAGDDIMVYDVGSAQIHDTIMGRLERAIERSKPTRTIVTE